MTATRPRGLCARRSFTLVEIMAVVTIIGVVATLGVSKLKGVAERARETRAIEQIRMLFIELSAQESPPETLAGINRAGMLDPWGRPYQYLLFKTGAHGGPPPGARKDRFLVPINSRFDLYSMGADGETTPPLTAARSRDDIILANDGAYIGRASGY